jgi:glycosyltransferase involved in cell wall biosynthesis
VVASAIPGYEKVACAPGPDGSIPESPVARLVAPGDPVELAAALSEVLGTPDVAGRLREGGHRRAAAFDMEALVDRYEEVYAGILRR